jgi:hypothetical protein
VVLLVVLFFLDPGAVAGGDGAGTWLLAAVLVAWLFTGLVVGVCWSGARLDAWLLLSAVLVFTGQWFGGFLLMFDGGMLCLGACCCLVLMLILQVLMILMLVPVRLLVILSV